MVTNYPFSRNIYEGYEALSEQDIYEIGYKMGYADGLDKADIQSRPKGEWINRMPLYPSDVVKKCNLCGHETDTWRHCNYCPNGGADMRMEYGKKD